MRRYIEHIKTKEPHERRKHAVQLSAVFVGMLFFAWLATFAGRLSLVPPSPDSDPTQVAAVANSTMLPQGAAQVEVSTTSVYSY